MSVSGTDVELAGVTCERLLGVASRAVTADIKALLHPLGVTPLGRGVLTQLFDAQSSSLTPSILAGLTLTSAPSITSACAALLERGLVMASRSLGDARRHPVRLADQGRVLVVSHRRAVEAAADTLHPAPAPERFAQWLAERTDPGLQRLCPTRVGSLAARDGEEPATTVVAGVATPKSAELLGALMTHRQRIVLVVSPLQVSAPAGMRAVDVVRAALLPHQLTVRVEGL